MNEETEWRSELHVHVRHVTQALYSHDVNVSRNREVLILKVEITTHLWILDKNDTSGFYPVGGAGGKLLGKNFKLPSFPPKPSSFPPYIALNCVSGDLKFKIVPGGEPPDPPPLVWHLGLCPRLSFPPKQIFLDRTLHMYIYTAYVHCIYYGQSIQYLTDFAYTCTCM